MRAEPAAISFLTLIKIAAVGLLVYGLIEARSVLFLLLLSGLLAAALDPMVQWLERLVPRGLALLFLVVVVGGSVGLAAYFIFPSVADQASRIAEHIPVVVERLLHRLPSDNFVRGAAEKMLDRHRTDFNNLDTWMPRLLVAGRMFFGLLTSLLFVYVFTIYFLLDGRRAFLWMTAFFTPPTRKKILATADGVVSVVSAYFVGQIVSSTLSFTFVFVLLKSLGVPAALTLALMAGIFDILPLIGIFLSLVPALIFALTISPTTALIVTGSFGVYHLCEAYVITPTVFGHRLRLSGLSVLLGLLVGSSLGGIVGAIVILPIIASYPIVEKIWLAHFLGRDALAKHHALEYGESKLDEMKKTHITP